MEGDMNTIRRWFVHVIIVGLAANLPAWPLAAQTIPIAPNPRAAAQYYPGGYWFSLIHVPDKREFATTASGSDPGGMVPNVKSQAEWLRILKSGGCWSCHQLGSKGTREIPEAFRSLPT